MPAARWITDLQFPWPCMAKQKPLPRPGGQAQVHEPFPDDFAEALTYDHDKDGWYVIAVFRVHHGRLHQNQPTVHSTAKPTTPIRCSTPGYGCYE